MDKQTIKNVVEYALLTSSEPLALSELKRLFDEDGDISEALEELKTDWSARALRLVQVADGYQLIGREGYIDYLRRLRPKRPARLSRQLLEVLAVIAYRQPATRGDIEQIRGVSVSSLQLATLEEFGWIEEIGRRATPGRPILYSTTNNFLNDLAIASLEELPPLDLDDLQEELEFSDSDSSATDNAADADSNDSNVDSNAAESDADSTPFVAESAAESESDAKSESESATDFDDDAPEDDAAK